MKTGFLSIAFASVLLGTLAPTLASAATPPMRVSMADEEFVGPFASWGNLKKYGAVGDGVADDTVAFQKALDDMALRSTNQYGWNIYKAGSPSVMYIPAGRYRITKTLYLKQKLSVDLVGENPATTTIVWDGVAGGTMMIVDGVKAGRFSRLTWQGSGKAGIGVAHWWNTSSSNPYGGAMHHLDEVFVDMGVGIDAGCCGKSSTATAHPGTDWSATQYGQLDSEGSIRRTKFIRMTVAGLSTESPNALDWWVWDSEFTDCYRGVTNILGAGNFLVYRNLFQRSKLADINIGNTGWFSMHNNVSVGSRRFMEAAEVGRNPAQLILQGNRVLDFTDPSAVFNGNLGAMMLIDNEFRSLSSSIGPVVRQENFASGRDVVSVNNHFTIANMVKMRDSTDRLIQVQDAQVAGTAISSTLPASIVTPANTNRTVFEVPVKVLADTLTTEATADDIQATINAAAASSADNPVVHMPPGIYRLDKAVVLPARRRIQLVGDGLNTMVVSKGDAARVPLIRLLGPSYATVRDMTISAPTSTAIMINGADQVGGRIFIHGLSGGQLNVTGLHNTRVEGQSNPMFNGIRTSDSQSVLVTGSGPVGPVGIYSNSNLMMMDSWYEGTKTALFRGDSGNFTYMGGHLAPADHGGTGTDPSFYLNNYTGRFSVIGLVYKLKLASNGILVDVENPNTKAFVMGVSSNLGSYFQRKSSGGAVGFRMMKTPDTTTLQAPDLGLTTADHLIGGLQQARMVSWDSAPYVAPDGATNVHIYRVMGTDTAVGLEITSSN